MTYQSVAGGLLPILGPNPLVFSSNGQSMNTNTLNAANSASICIGRIMTSDGGSHTLDTSGSSKLEWRTDTGVTFASGSTSVSVGLALVDISNGGPGRASNSAGAISFDVKGVFAGGGGGITNNTWQSSVPTAGSKTIANGDLVAFAVQMTARGGTDQVTVDNATFAAGTQNARPSVTSTSNGTSFSAKTALPNVFITFHDGATGWFEGGEVVSTQSTRTWNSGSATKEYGQLYQMPFPMQVAGFYGLIGLSANCDLVLYSDPLGTPVAQKTNTIDFHTVGSTGGTYFRELFASPYSVPANTPIGAVFKPGASNVNAYFKTQANSAHRVSDAWGTSGYGISRASGAFANANSSLDHYFIGLILSGFDNGLIRPNSGIQPIEGGMSR